MPPACVKRVRQAVEERHPAVEPVIGHVKTEHRMGRNYLWHRQGGAINTALAAAGYNLMPRWSRLLLLRILAVLSASHFLVPA
jgi:IS5 family transposase